MTSGQRPPVNNGHYIWVVVVHKFDCISNLILNFTFEVCSFEVSLSHSNNFVCIFSEDFFFFFIFWSLILKCNLREGLVQNELTHECQAWQGIFMLEKWKELQKNENHSSNMFFSNKVLHKFQISNYSISKLIFMAFSNKRV